MSSRKTAKDILLAAEQQLKKRGWRQDDYGSTEGPNCLVGALAVASNSSPGQVEGSDSKKTPLGRAVRALKAITGWSELVDFNDSSDMTKRKVLKTVRQAIEAVSA